MNLFAVRLAWVPLLGANSWKSYILPAITLALLPRAVIARMCRASMLDIIHQDYIRTARAKGLSTTKVYLQPRSEKCADPNRHHCRDEFRFPAGGRRYHGNGIQLARTWPA